MSIIEDSASEPVKVEVNTIAPERGGKKPETEWIQVVTFDAPTRHGFAG
jgi:hypothetical protein